MVAPGGGACVVARGCVCGFCRGVCMVFAGGCAWFLPGGVHGFSRGGGVHNIRRDTVNERAVRILLECILVVKKTSFEAHSFFQR